MTVVVVGFVAKKAWTEGEKRKVKRVSQVFSCRSAADAFCQLAKKTESKAGVEYFVTSVSKEDGLPAWL